MDEAVEEAEEVEEDRPKEEEEEVEETPEIRGERRKQIPTHRRRKHQTISTTVSKSIRFLRGSYQTAMEKPRGLHLPTLSINPSFDYEEQDMPQLL